MPEGADRFSKMVLLFEQHYNAVGGIAQPVPGQKLTPQETSEVNEYVRICRDNDYCAHPQVNNHITSNDLWSRFPTIRSLNDHGSFTGIPGIQPKYFEIVCQLLGISGGDGLPLDAFRKY